MKNNVIRTVSLFMAVFLIFTIVPAMGVASDDNYEVSVEKALEHATAHVAYFSSTNASEFEKWSLY